MSIILTAIFDECERHFSKPEAKYYSCLHRTVLGAGYLLTQREEWEKQSTDKEKKSLITTRLHNLERLIK